MTSLNQKVIRLGFGIAGRLAPDITGRLAFRLFCTTPSRKPATAKARKVLADAQPIMARAERVMLPISSGAVAAHLFTPIVGQSSETVLVTHGWGARTEHMLPIVEGLRSSGRSVVALDLPGHGASTGRTLNMALAVEAVDAAWRQFGPFTTMVGHSFGGAVVVNAAYGSVCYVPPRTPEKLVTISAPNSLLEIFEWFADWIGLSTRSRKVLYGEAGRVTGRSLEKFVGARQISALKRPTLVIHAHDDKEIAVDNAYGLVGAGPHVEVFWADGYGHRRILGGPDVSQVVVDFADRGSSVGSDNVASPGIGFSNTHDAVTHS